MDQSSQLTPLGERDVAASYLAGKAHGQDNQKHHDATQGDDQHRKIALQCIHERSPLVNNDSGSINTGHANGIDSRQGP